MTTYFLQAGKWERMGHRTPELWESSRMSLNIVFSFCAGWESPWVEFTLILWYSVLHDHTPSLWHYQSRLKLEAGTAATKHQACFLCIPPANSFLHQLQSLPMKYWKHKISSSKTFLKTFLLPHYINIENNICVLGSWNS